MKVMFSTDMGRVSRGSTGKVEVGILPHLEEQVSAAPLENDVPGLISPGKEAEELASQVERVQVQIYYSLLGGTTLRTAI